MSYIPLSSLPSPSPHPSPSPYASLPRPLGTDAPPTREVPPFAPVRVRGGRDRMHRLDRLVRHRRRAVAAGLAVTAAALLAVGPPTGADPRDERRARGHPAAGQDPQRRAAQLVAAPVRIADAETVRLLRPGDRVDVVAAGAGGGVGGAGGGAGGGTGGGVSVLARGARVTEVPETADPGGRSGQDGQDGQDGALVVLSVPRGTAVKLVGAGALARLAVTLC
ncbi:hypothetical protein [Streptomyces fumanus]|uniref:hypothetical protein n=1 Tax=Streptomyces fumanus TaxID=67302 RepID=UPI0033F2100B